MIGQQEQTMSSPLSLLPLPEKTALLSAFKGKRLADLHTPALIVDRAVFQRNCERMAGEIDRRGLQFRAHVKTHKTTEGIRLQCQAGKGVRALIASTIPEVWHIAESGLVQDGLVDDILYSLPISPAKIPDVAMIQSRVGSTCSVRVMVDHPTQIHALADHAKSTGRSKWSVFVKVDGGGKRAGNPPESDQMKAVIQACKEREDGVEVYGFYSHFGQSYASKSLDKAAEYFLGEVTCVNTAAIFAQTLGLAPPSSRAWTLSVGATPTAHAASLVQGQSDPLLSAGVDRSLLSGTLEIHAGCYCMNDLQQLATSLPSPADCALTVLGRVVSTYPARGGGEAMCDIGALAVSKDTGPWAGYGHVVWPEKVKGWDLGRISQEHGTLTHRPAREGADGETIEVQASELEVGELIRIIPQHACLVCASHPWLYVVEDGGDEVVDVWVTWKGW